jgi:hypothetical protein
VCFVPGLDAQVRQPRGTNLKRQSSSSDAPLSKRPANTALVPEQHVALSLEETIAKLERQVEQQNARIEEKNVLLSRAYAVEAQLHTKQLTTTSENKISALEAKRALAIARKAEASAKQNETTANARAIADLLEKDDENEALAKIVKEQEAQIKVGKLNLAKANAALNRLDDCLKTFERITDQMDESTIAMLKV